MPRAPLVESFAVRCETDNCRPPIAIVRVGRRSPWMIAVEMRPPDSDPRMGDDPLTFAIPALRCFVEGPEQRACDISMLHAEGVAHQARFIGFSTRLVPPRTSARLHIEWSYCNDRLEERLGRVCTSDRGTIEVTLAP